MFKRLLFRNPDVKAAKQEAKRTRKEEKKLAKQENKKSLKKTFMSTLQTTTKQLIWWFTINGTIWIYCSYVLAFQGKDQIAESLSSNVCTVIIGQMIMYIISKTFENACKYNDLFGKSNEAALAKEGITTPEVITTPAPEPFVDPTAID